MQNSDIFSSKNVLSTTDGKIFNIEDCLLTKDGKVIFENDIYQLTKVGSNIHDYDAFIDNNKHVNGLRLSIRDLEKLFKSRLKNVSNNYIGLSEETLLNILNNISKGYHVVIIGGNYINSDKDKAQLIGFLASLLSPMLVKDTILFKALALRKSLISYLELNTCNKDNLVTSLSNLDKLILGESVFKHIYNTKEVLLIDGLLQLDDKINNNCDNSLFSYVNKSIADNNSTCIVSVEIGIDEGVDDNNSKELVRKYLKINGINNMEDFILINLSKDKLLGTCSVTVDL